MPNPFRLTIRWLAADAFPRCRVVIGNDPPRPDYEVLSSWFIPNVQTSEEVAIRVDQARKGIDFAYTGDQLRVLAVKLRQAGNVPIADPMKFPWYSGASDPYGDLAYQFECDYQGKAGKGTLLLWVAEIRVEN